MKKQAFLGVLSPSKAPRGKEVENTTNRASKRLKTQTGPISRASEQRVSVLHRKLKELRKQIIRKLYPNECYTCGQKNLSGCNWHTGHLIAEKSLGAFLKHDLRLLRPQCYNCNINLGGMGAVFLMNMIIREGQEYVDGIFRDRAVIVKAYDHYEMMIQKYQLMLEDLEAGNFSQKETKILGKESE